MTAGTRRNGTSKVGPFNRAVPAHRAQPHNEAPDGRALGLTGWQDAPGDKTARFRAGKVVPAAAVAATVAAGATAFALMSSGGTQPQASQLNAALGGQPGGTAGIGQAKGAAAITGTPTATARPAGKHAKQSPRARPSATPAASSPAAPSSPQAAPSSPQAAPSSPTAAKPAKTASSPPPAATGSTLSCNLSVGLLPDNVTTIVSFLLAHGYSHNAAAGIAGNIYQESKGNPESVGMGGGGLIGWTPLHAGMVTGNPTADLNTQLAALLTYNQGWAQYIPALNAAATPADAAAIYVTDFERAGIPAASTRESSAQAIANACGL